MHSHIHAARKPGARSKANMINNGFYPTPQGVINGMLGLLKRPLSNYNLVLDPSAGKGDLLEGFLWARLKQKWADRENQQYRYNDEYDLREHKPHEMESVVAIEIENDLRAILRDHNIRVIGDDFLKWNGREQPDLILMNPPFAAGAEHLVHAWRVLHEGEIVCLLNAETLKNPYTHARQHLLEIIQGHDGVVKHLGRPFKDAERSTNAEIAMVYLQKKAGDSDFSFEFTNTQETPEFNPEDMMTQLAPGGVIEVLDAFLVAAQRQFAEVMKGMIKLQILAQPFTSDYSRSFEKLMPESLKNPTAAGARDAYNTFARTINEFAWGSILDHPKFASMMTSRARRDFEEFRKEQKQLEFSAFNVRQMINVLMGRSAQIMEQCILDVFDELRKYDRDNTSHWEGWATNDAFRVNRKFIHPYAVSYDKKFDSWSVSWSQESILADIDKALCIVTGYPLEEIRTIGAALTQAVRHASRGTPSPIVCQSTFFYMKCWKKGTVHFEFKDDAVWEAFNLRAAQGKKWVRAAPKQPKAKQEGFAFEETNEGETDPQPA
jgi:hypothetical protein